MKKTESRKSRWTVPLISTLINAFSALELFLVITSKSSRYNKEEIGNSPHKLLVIFGRISSYWIQQNIPDPDEFGFIIMQ